MLRPTSPYAPPARAPRVADSHSHSPTRSPRQPDRQAKRLSRISPSEFDSLLSSSSTKHTTLVDESTLGTTQPSPDRDRDRDPVTPEKDRDSDRDPFKRRSMFRSVGNASSPDLASLVRKARQQRLLDSVEPGTALGIREFEHDGELDGSDDDDQANRDDVESPTKPRRARSPSPPDILRPLPTRSRSTTSPEISLSEFAAQQPQSSPNPASPARVFTSPTPSARAREATTLSTESTTSSSNASSGFVVIPSLPPQSPERSVTSTVHALKSLRQQGGPAPSFESMNRSTASLVSNFADSSPSRRRTNTSGGSGGTTETKLSLGNTMRKTSRFFRKFGAGGVSAESLASTTPAVAVAPVPSPSQPPSVPLPPPVPPIPSTYTSPARPSTALAPNSPSPSSRSIASSNSTSSPRVVRRRRSLSVPQPQPQSATSAASNFGGAGGEGDRLRNELRMWRLGVDGVLNSGGGGEGSGASHTDGAWAGERRPSLPEGRGGRDVATSGGIEMERRKNKSLPIYSSTGAVMPPSIRLSSPTRKGGGIVPVGFGHDQATADELSSIEETSHSRENSNATIVSQAPPPLPLSLPLPLPMSPPMVPTPSSSTSNVRGKNANSRVSIVGYPTTPFGAASPRNLAVVTTTTTTSPTATSPTSPPSPRSSPRLSTTPASASTTSTLRHLARPPSVPPPTTRSQNGTGGTMGDHNDDEDNEESRAIEFAEKCWNEDSGFLERNKIAEWLGSSHGLNRKALRHYVDRFEFEGMRLDQAFRRLCHKLYLKGETQQVDRILEQFSNRYHRENPKSPYSSADVVHAVSYSMLLLNTDLHVVDTTTNRRMTRQQFVRNTMNAIEAQQSGFAYGADAAEGESAGGRGGSGGGGGGGESATRGPREHDHGNDGVTLFSPTVGLSGGGGGAGAGVMRGPPRAIGEPGRPASPSQNRVNLVGGGTAAAMAVAAGEGGAGGETGLGLSQRSESVMTVGSVGSNKSTSVASAAGQQANLQLVLKDMYNSIRAQPIYQSSISSTAGNPSGSGSTLNLIDTSGPSSSRPSFSLSPTSTGGSPYSTWATSIHRTATNRTNSSATTTNNNNNKRASVRGFGQLLSSTHAAGSGSGSTFDLVRSPSPTPSNSTLGDHHYSSYSSVPLAQHQMNSTIGFANSLTHTIIREHELGMDGGGVGGGGGGGGGGGRGLGGDNDDGAEARSIKSLASSTVSMTDEELSLVVGAPWGKEGMLERKHYWEAKGKRSKDNKWLKAFVVVNGSKGELSMFRFDGARGGGSRGGGRKGIVGGGDWTSNASDVGSISLIHSLCSTMPPPGYSRDRPHCFVLSLADGGSYFFQAGTPDLVQEWVSTCNYWSARLSREPLSGGVSNIEYGWNKVDESKFTDDLEATINMDRVGSSIKSGKSGHSRISAYASSTFGGGGPAGQGGTLGGPNDRMRIDDWKPPNVPVAPSQLGEEAQLDHLKRHVRIVQQELQRHNELRNPMVKLYSSRSSNCAKAVANWERKSQHLLTEIVKWSTYIEALTSAVKLRSIQRGKKQVEAMLKSADLDDDEDDDDELARRLSPFDEGPIAPPQESVVAATTGDLTRTRRHDERRPSTATSVSYPSISRTSVKTTSTRGEEFFDSNDSTPPAVL